MYLMNKNNTLSNRQLKINVKSGCLVNKPVALRPLEILGLSAKIKAIAHVLFRSRFI